MFVEVIEINLYLVIFVLLIHSQDLPELESKIEDPWKNLFVIQEATGRKLGWELSAMFGHSW
jgi:hypothetical protein